MIHHARLSSIVFAVAIAILIGFFIGRISTSNHIKNELTITTAATESLQTVVQIDRMQAGNLVGSIKGDARVFIGEQLVVPQADTTFNVAATSLLTNHIAVLVPPGMNYVASKQGSKFYSVHSKQGGKLTPKNRVYFETVQQALDAGYRQ